MGRVEPEEFRPGLRLLWFPSRSSQVGPSALPLFPEVGLACSLPPCVEMTKEDWLRPWQKPVFLPFRSSQLGPSLIKLYLLETGPS